VFGVLFQDGALVVMRYRPQNVAAPFVRAMNRAAALVRSAGPACAPAQAGLPLAAANKLRAKLLGRALRARAWRAALALEHGSLFVDEPTFRDTGSITARAFDTMVRSLVG